MRILIVTILSFLSYLSIAQITRHADISQEIGYSARQLSLGNSSLGTRANSFDVFLNPALITQLDSLKLGYTHNNHFGGIIQLDNIAFVSPIKESKWAYGLSLFRLKNSQAFDSRSLLSSDGSISYNELTTTDNNDFGFKFVIGKTFDSLGLDLGLELGVDVLSVSNFSRASSFGIDLGGTKELDSLTVFSVVVENIIGRYYFWDQSVSQLESVFFSTENFLQVKSTAVQLPYLKVGLNRFLLNNSGFLLDASTSLGLGYGRSSNTLFGSASFNLSPSFGLEASYQKIFFVRLGTTSFQKNNNKVNVKPSVGFGVDYKGFKVDYGASNFLSSSIPLQQHVISLNYGFNAKNKSNNLSDNPRRF